VNNAGWDRAANFVDTDPAFWRDVIDINLYGPLHVTRALLPGLLSRGAGRVVSIASDAGRVGSSGESVYAACKGGVIAFTKAVAREVARHGVTLNCVAPGPTDTDLLAGIDPSGRLQQALARAIPLGRVGRPEDLPGAVAFLLSDDAAFVTGQTLSVSGGLTMV
jgi:2-hydroxycyclohexanecarboxyl-CoA dehydrogenase